MEKQFWWSFSYEAMMYPDIELVEWLKGQKPRLCREKVMEAVRGYWNAIAAFETGFKTNAELKILGLNCCIELEYRSDYIRSMFSLPSRGKNAAIKSG